MTIFILETILLLFAILFLLFCLQALAEWRRADRDDYEQRYLNKNRHVKTQQKPRGKKG